LHQIAEKSVPLFAGTMFEISPPQPTGVGIAVHSMAEGKGLRTLLLGIAGFTGMIVDVGDIKGDLMFEEKMEEGGRIDPAGKSEEGFSLFEEV
jgi:hypothetical protein